MKKLIFIDIKDKKFYSKNNDTASSKPRLDTGIIAQNNGFYSTTIYNLFLGIEPSSLIIKILFSLRILQFLNNLFFYVQSLKLLTYKNCILLVQYPFFNRKMAKRLKYLKKSNRLIILVHDLESFRSSERRYFEIQTFNLADILIVHSSAMKRILLENGCTCHFEELEFFDFLSKYQAHKPVELNHFNILYAGNLTKSKFISELSTIKNDSRNLKFFLYGRCDQSLKTNETIIYKGVFSNDHIDLVEGNWGLVWDGDSSETCRGINGDYLRINAPYKMSLYLALGIPVIVWSESAMAEYVKKYNLGICINKLQDIEEEISSLNDDQKAKMEKGIKEFSQKVKEGSMLTTVVKECLCILNNL